MVTRFKKTRILLLVLLWSGSVFLTIGCGDQSFTTESGQSKDSQDETLMNQQSQSHADEAALDNSEQFDLSQNGFSTADHDWNCVADKSNPNKISCTKRPPKTTCTAVFERVSTRHCKLTLTITGNKSAIAKLNTSAMEVNKTRAERIALEAELSKFNIGMLREKRDNGVSITVPQCPSQAWSIDLFTQPPRNSKTGTLIGSCVATLPR